MRIFIKTSQYFLLIISFNFGIQAQVSDFKSIDFSRADYVASIHKGAPIHNLPLLAHQLTHSLPTQVEKFRAIYKWVCHNIRGDYAQHHKVSYKRKKLKNDSLALAQWNQVYKRTAFKKLLKYKKTMCTGYAYLIKELCLLVNIEAVIVDGYGRSVEANIKTLDSPNHSWNAIKLNNKWYLCDATWSSGYMVAGNIFVADYNDGYFLADPLLFGKNHFPLIQKWLLDQQITIPSFTNAPLVYGKTFEHKILPLQPKNLENKIHKYDEITFSFKSTSVIAHKNVALVYYSANKERILPIENIQHQNGIVSFNYKFKHKGTYDTHLKINNDIVASYTFKVSKKDKNIY